MERNRWETALRCLEVALHPNTSDDEVIAGVNGFRRTAGDMRLREMCVRLAADSAPLAEPVDELDRLSQENHDLRRRLELAETIRSVTVRRVEQRLCALGEELAAARLRADAAERHLTDFGSAHVAVTDGLRQEISNLRLALEQARHGAVQLKAPGTVPMFRDFLAAAHRGTATSPRLSRYPAAAERGPEGAGPVISTSISTSPWTA